MEPDAFNVVSGLEPGQPQCLGNGLVRDDSRVVIAYESDAPFARPVHKSTRWQSNGGDTSSWEPL